VRSIARFFPLTHILDAARAVMLDGATLAVVLPDILLLLLMSVLFLALGAAIFRWTPN
jgi:ABC-type multidrug transport system permease subunit